MIRFSILAYCCSLFIFDSSLFVVFKETPIFSQTNFALAYIKSFNSVMSFVGILVNKSFTFSVSDLTVLQSRFTREVNVVFFSGMILLMICTLVFFSWVSVCVCVFTVHVLYSDLRPGQTCHSKVMPRKEVTHSDVSYERKSPRLAWLTKWDKVKNPMVHS